MSQILLLDEGPLSLVTNPRESAQSRRCKEWLASILARGSRNSPGDCRLRAERELLRANRLNGIDRLDELIDRLGYLHVDRDVFQYAATLWAWARTEGIPTAEDTSLDSDVILAAQAQIAARDSGDEVIVVTTNVAHLERFVAAQRWDTIIP